MAIVLFEENPDLSKYFDHVEKVEADYWKIDGLTESEIPPVIINVYDGDDDDDGDGDGDDNGQSVDPTVDVDNESESDEDQDPIDASIQRVLQRQEEERLREVLEHNPFNTAVF